MTYFLPVDLHRQLAMDYSHMGQYPPPPSQWPPYPYHYYPPHSHGISPPHHSPQLPQAVDTVTSQLQENVPPRTPSSDSPYWYNQPESHSQSTGHVQLSQEMYDVDPLHASQNSSHGYAPSQNLPAIFQSQDLSVLSQSQNFQRLSLGRDSPQFSQGRIMYAVNTTPQGGSFQLDSLPLDCERDRIAGVGHESHPLSYYENQLDTVEKDVIMDVKYVNGICSHMNSWESTARVGYGFSEAEVIQLKSDYPMQPFKERAYQAYLKWKMHKGYISVTARRMLQVLYEAEEFEAINFLIKKIKGLENV